MALALRCQLVEPGCRTTSVQSITHSQYVDNKETLLVLLLHVVMQNEVAESKENEASGERDVLKPQTPTGTCDQHILVKYWVSPTTDVDRGGNLDASWQLLA
eukprot:758727-Rhodomonas_salina.1